MNAPWAFLNGEWVPGPGLSIDVNDAGFVLGATVTERLRTFRGQVFRLEEHLRRMRRSLEIVGLPAEEIAQQIGSAVLEFVDRNRDSLPSNDDWSISAFATPGVAGRPTVCVHGYPLQFHQWAAFYETGLPVLISDVQQVPPACLPPELKCRSRMHFYLADCRAKAIQSEARAILLDEDGFVAESTTANVVLYRQNEGLVSPPPEHILIGVSLGVVQELAEQLEIPVIASGVTVDDLRTADEALLSSTSVCLLPVVECDGQPIADGQPGPIFRRLLTAWSDLVGIDIANQSAVRARRS